jgi:hypothetical protein
LSAGFSRFEEKATFMRREMAQEHSRAVVFQRRLNLRATHFSTTSSLTKPDALRAKQKSDVGETGEALLPKKYMATSYKEGTVNKLLAESLALE